MGARYLTDLAEVCRRTGYPVIEVDGWQHRARGSGGYDPGRPNHVMIHHTASGPSSDGWPDVNYCTFGDDDAPLCNLYLDRQGVIYVCAAGATNCLMAGTIVTTRRGLIPIENVTVGDEVWTHRGRWRRVTGTQIFRGRPVVELRPHGWGPIIGTGDHPWWTYDGWSKRGMERWKPAPPQFRLANDLRGEHLLVSPPCPDAEPPTIGGFTVTPELCRFAGAYVADGNARVGSDGGQVYLTVNPAKAPVIEGWARAAGLTCRLDDHDGAVRIRIRRATDLARFLLEHFGATSADKTVPLWILSHDKRAEMFLDGYIHGDGWWNSHHPSSGPYWMATTSSRRLAVGLAMLGRRLGWAVTASTHEDQSPIVIKGKRTRANHPVWRVRMVPEGGRRRIHGDDWLSPVRWVRPAGVATVYDITVADDHSFVADGFLCHNTNGSGHDPCGVTPDDSMNSSAIGIEAGNDGSGEPWSASQLDSYLALCAELCAAYGIPVGRVHSHWEWAPDRKVDPAGPPRPYAHGMSWDMDDFRADLGHPAPTPPGGDDVEKYLCRDTDGWPVVTDFASYATYITEEQAADGVNMRGYIKGADNEPFPLSESDTDLMHRLAER